MSAILMEGRPLADTLKTLLQKRVEALVQKGLRPGLAVILVGEDPASRTYVAMKMRQCAAIGIDSYPSFLPQDTSRSTLESLIEALNHDERVHGILLQLPLPPPLDANTLSDQIAPQKDVDGLTKYNIGALIKQDPLAFLPCTPKGCLKLLETYVGNISGRSAVIVGRSHLVGRPLAQLLLQKDCTVCLVHSKTTAPETYTREADILIAATGHPGLIKASWVKPGAAVIDVGITHLNTSQGTKIVGDVAFDHVKEVAGYLTPVPGGVGPMTVACLLENTLEAAERNLAPS